MTDEALCIVREVGTSFDSVAYVRCNRTKSLGAAPDCIRGNLRFCLHHVTFWRSNTFTLLSETQIPKQVPCSKDKKKNDDRDCRAYTYLIYRPQTKVEGTKVVN